MRVSFVVTGFVRVIQVATESDVEQALTFHKKTFAGGRYVEVFRASVADFKQALSQDKAADKEVAPQIK